MVKITNTVVLTGVILDEHATITLTEVRQRFAIEESLLHEMIEYGLIELINNENEERIDLSAVNRVQAALRLYHDLGVNMPGVALVLDLRDELEEMKKQLEILHKQIE